MKRIPLILAGLALAFCAPLADARDLRSKGVLRVIVLDEQGTYVPDAHVYFYHRNQKRFFDASVKEGVLLMEVPEGKYRIYSAVTRRGGGYIDRYISHEAHVRVHSDEPASVLLTLKNAQQPITYMSESTRKKIGLSPELVRHIN